MSEPTQEQPAVDPGETSRSPWHISRIPGHLGRARTSTVVLAVLFVAIFALYLNIKPDAPGAVTSGTGGQVPASTTAPAPVPVPQDTAPTTTPEPTQDVPTTTETPTPSDLPTGTSTSELPTDSTAPTTATLPTPTVSTPSG